MVIDTLSKLFVAYDSQSIKAIITKEEGKSCLSKNDGRDKNQQRDDFGVFVVVFPNPVPYWS